MHHCVMGSCLSLKRRPTPQEGRQRHFSTPTLNSLASGLYRRFAQSSANVPRVIITGSTPMGFDRPPTNMHLDSVNTTTGIKTSLPHCNLGLFVLDTLKQMPPHNKLFSVFEERTLTVGEVINQAKTTFCVLQSLNVPKGETLLGVLSNCSQLPALIIACCLLQLPLLLLSHKAHLENKAVLNQLKSMNASVILCTKDLSSKAEKMRASLEKVQQVVVVDCEIPSNKGHTSLSRLQSTCLPTTAAVEDVVVDLESRADWGQLPALSLFTMGRTSGTPRLLHHSHKTLLASAIGTMKSVFYAGENGVTLGLLPLYHVFGVTVQLLPCLLTGLHLILLPHSDPTTFLNCIETHQVKNCLVAPSALDFLAANASVDNVDISSVGKVLCCTGPPKEITLQSLYKRYVDINVSIGYGMCETSGLTHLSPATRLMTRASGKVLPNVQAKIEDVRTFRAVANEKMGEVCVRTPSLVQVKSTYPALTYKDNSEWLHTGDMGYFDRNRNFYITSVMRSRTKDEETPRVLNFPTRAVDTESVGSDNVFLD